MPIKDLGETNILKIIEVYVSAEFAWINCLKFQGKLMLGFFALWAEHAPERTLGFAF